MKNYIAKKLFVVSLLAFQIIIVSSSFGQSQITQDPLVVHIDTTIKPGDDFFQYANGRWFKENPIPASEAYNGLWRLIQDTINTQIRTMCESSAALTNAEKGSNKQKIGDFFYTGMDSLSINKNGVTDLKKYFEMIDRISDIKGIVQAAAYIHTVADAPMFTFGVGQDDRISSKNAVFIWQGGLSLPDKRYYFDSDSAAMMIRQKYVMHIGNMFKILGYDSEKAKQASENMMMLEIALAKTSRNREDTRDPLKNYNKISFKELTRITPNLDWSIFTEGVGLSNVDTVIVGQPEFLTALNGYLKTVSIDTWKNYLKYHLVRSLAAYLDDKTYLEIFSFYSATLRGVKEPKARWKRVVERTDGSLGELIGQVYMSEYLPKGTKEKLLEIGNAVKEVYAERIKKLDWMSDATKVKALKKLSTIIMKVGFPDKWKDLSKMQIDRSSYVCNVMSANMWGFRYMISKYGKPVDRSEWDMEPQTYNAYYNPSNNEICVPGCNIIIPGYERTLADDALLYSNIGATFGHEITHGFDDQGSKYDNNGNLNNWWTSDDSSKFYTKTKMIVKQYNEYIAVDSLHINGELTQGENIADLAGTMMAYEAFKKTHQYKSNELIAGLQSDRRFFLGYAFAWMVNERPEAIANQVRSNEHSPAKFRVIGPLSNMPEFDAAFGIKHGDAMWRADSTKVVIW
jgi:putative endopeptidase